MPRFDIIYSVSKMNKNVRKIFKKSKVERLICMNNKNIWIYEKSDTIIFLKEGTHTYITDKKWDLEQGDSIDLKKCHYINNGVDIESFDRQISEDTISDIDLNDNKFNVVYTGAIRPVNNIEIFLMRQNF